MFFSKIELYNYGIYKGLHTINLVDQFDNKNITLVGGMNGRGKTTILDSIFLCLYGRKSVEYITGKREAYNKLLEDHINKSAIDKSTYIKITLHMDDDKNTIIAVNRSWTQIGKKIDTSLSVEKNGIQDSYLSENWEYYVEELIPFGIAKFFFFDNEKISQIADDDAFDKIKDSIKSVMGVTTIESLCNHIDKIRKEKNNDLKKSENAKLTKESEDLSNSIEECETRIRNLFAQKAALVPILEKNNDLLAQTEQLFWKKGGNLGLNQDDIIRDQHAIKEKIEYLKEEAINLASNPATPLCLCKKLTITTYNKINSEENARAKEYSLPIVTDLYAELLDNFKDSYSEETDTYKLLANLVNNQLDKLKKETTLKQTNIITPLSKNLMEKFVSNDYNALILKAKQLFSDNEKALTALQQLEVHLSSSAEKNDTIKLLNDIKQLQAKKTQLEGEIGKCEDQIHSAQFEKEQYERQLNKVILKIAANADTSDDNVRIIEYSTMSLEIMHEFVQRLQAQKVNQLEKNITSCFDFLAQKQAIITSISINPETLDITLRDYNGGILLKDQLSAGEKQMFAISILWGLALSSGYKLPVIIDTPMARLDSAHRSNFINKYLPNASSQVIVLSTDEEINGKYLDDIKEYVSTSYTLVYDEVEKCSTIHKGYFGGNI
ncbi:MAG: DNA sulfur modification protein DndD [Lachnospiraceae bacterium]|nr:DNA sulfur modification protein DndD [Lachnospiraceae bacterium]